MAGRVTPFALAGEPPPEYNAPVMSRIPAPALRVAVPVLGLLILGFGGCASSDRSAAPSTSTSALANTRAGDDSLNPWERERRDQQLRLDADRDRASRGR